MSPSPSPKPEQTPIPIISIEVSKEFYERLNNLASELGGGSIEQTVMFLLGQALEAPAPALKWMRAKLDAHHRSFEGHREPTIPNAWQAYEEGIIERARQENKAAINLADAVLKLVKQ
jgi:hypothetical protein